LPARAAARRARLKALKEEARTLVFYESPHRVQGTLDDVAESFGASRGASVAREITKLHETLYRGSLGELARRAREEPDFTRGEIVIVVAGATLRDDGEGNPESREAILDRALRVLLPELPLKQAAHLAARIADARDNEAYKRALKLRQSGEPGEV
jgi:16S rRNA (cytidine1402-2'-O)-methyltransferase